MRVLALVPSERDINPGQRYRIEQWEPWLRRRGVELTYAPFSFPALSRVLYRPGHLTAKAALVAAAYVRQLSSVLKAHRFDLVFLFREAALVGPALLESLVAWQGAPIVYDFDDAIFVPYKSPSNSYLSYLKCFGKTAGLCKRASWVMVGNAYLEEYAKRYNPHVSLIPTTIDTDWYRPEARRPGSEGPPTVGWTGSYSSYQYLEQIFPALERLARRQPFRLVLVGTQAAEIPGVDVVFRLWRSRSEVEDLADIDIGIMPLPDDAWSRGKCGLKALQYMALGIPAIVSPVGVNTEIVTEGVNGLYAGTDDEWVERLGRLLEDEPLRRRLGRAARKTVEERYAAKVVAPRVYDVFRQAVSKKALRGLASRRARDVSAT